MTDDLTAQYVLATLPRGRDKARSLSDIAESTGLLRRTVEQGVLDLRLEGWPVASGPDGIWLGEAQDIAATIASLRGRLVSQYRTYLALRRTLRRMRTDAVEQLPLFGDGGAHAA